MNLLMGIKSHFSTIVPRQLCVIGWALGKVQWVLIIRYHQRMHILQTNLVLITIPPGICKPISKATWMKKPRTRVEYLRILSRIPTTHQLLKARGLMMVDEQTGICGTKKGVW
jgi:hypothetical protein